MCRTIVLLEQCISEDSIDDQAQIGQLLVALIELMYFPKNASVKIAGFWLALRDSPTSNPRLGDYSIVLPKLVAIRENALDSEDRQFIKGLYSGTFHLTLDNKDWYISYEKHKWVSGPNKCNVKITLENLQWTKESNDSVKNPIMQRIKQIGSKIKEELKGSILGDMIDFFSKKHIEEREDGIT